MIDQLIIREAVEEDLGAILKLALQWQKEGSTIGQEISEYEQYLENGLLLVALLQENIIGFLAATSEKEKLAIFDKHSQYVELDDLYVHASLRNKNVGSSLINWMKEIAKQSGISRFHVFSASKDIERVKVFYERHGFRMWAFQAYSIADET